MDNPQQRQREERKTRTNSPRPADGWQHGVLDFLLALLRERWLVLGVGVATVALWFVWCAVTPPFYRSFAVAVLMPREKPTLDASIRAGTVQTTDGAANRADSAPLMLPPNPDLYIELLSSRSVIGEIAARFADPICAAEGCKRAGVAGVLDSMVKVTGTEEGLLTVQATSHSPALASDLANAFVAAAQKASEDIERQLLDQQAGHLAVAIRDVEEKLFQAEQELATFQADHDLIDPQIESTDTLRQLRDARQLRDRLQQELNERLLAFTERDPKVQGIRERIRTTEDQMRLMAQQTAGRQNRTEYGQLVVRHGRLEERVRSCRDFLQTLRTGYDLFRVRAEQPAGSLVPIKTAAVPKTPSGPSKRRAMAVALVAGIGLAVGLALFRDQLRRLAFDAGARERLREFRALLPWIRTRPQAVPQP